MPPPQEGRLCFAQRAALLLWIAAQVMNASSLPGQPEGLNRAWKPGTGVPPIGDQPARAFAPAAAVETLNSTFVNGAAKQESPVELWPDTRPWAVHLPAGEQSDPLRGVEPPTWMLLGAATDNQQPPSPPPHIHGMPPHGRTRGPNKKSRAQPLGRGRARLSSPVVIPKTAY
jgi:hypothetical protein